MDESTEIITTDENPLQAVVQRVTDIDADTPHDEVAELRVKVDYLVGKARELKQLLDERMLEWLENDGDRRELVIGETRYYVGSKKKVVSGDTAALLEALLETTGGDFGEVAKLFSSQPFKHGACRGVLKDRWKDHFTELTEPDLSTGKPEKEIKAVDTRFTRKAVTSDAAE